MKRLIIATMTSFVMWASSIPALAMDWSRAFEKARYSIVALLHDGGNCTAFSINETDKYFFTAYHCINEDRNMLLWKETIPNYVFQGTFRVRRVVKKSLELDLAILEADYGMIAMVPGKEPQRGQELASIGYAFSESEPFILSSIVASVKDANAYGQKRRIVLKDNQDLSGMSGGPVIDRRGEVVTMVQQGLTVNGQVSNIAYGTSIKQIKEFAKGYWRTAT